MEAEEAFNEWDKEFKCEKCGHLYSRHGYDSDCEFWQCIECDCEQFEGFKGKTYNKKDAFLSGWKVALKSKHSERPSDS